MSWTLLGRRVRFFFDFNANFGEFSKIFDEFKMILLDVGMRPVAFTRLCRYLLIGANSMFQNVEKLALMIRATRSSSRSTNQILR